MRLKMPDDHQQNVIGIVFLAVACIAMIVLVAAGTFVPAPPAVSERVAIYTPPPKPEFKVINVALFGDSIAHGSGATDPNLGWAGRLKRHQAWNMTSLARGGTGFVSTVEREAAAQESCRRARCPNFGEMIPEAKAVAPDIIIVSGGRNDQRVPAAKEAAAIAGFFQQLRQDFPVAKIVATNALWDATPMPPALADISEAVKESVTAAGGFYFDLGQPLQGRPDLIGSDGLHPNNQGHELILGLVLNNLKAAGLTRQEE
ncbi:SGNH/GDSL hydrolase family protein [Paenarthrobacter nicotinovorans]|uniref:SGNH/GDSL hydrolase family protein n=1 Tax=Paenarthrobacter nicotinovorans TaxID=29320 RepID=UPI003DA23DED